MTPDQRQPFSMTVVGGVYRLNWEEAQVSATVERIRETRGVPTGEVVIKAWPEGHIHWTTLNLLSTRGRREVANFCAERGNMVQRDWSAIIEELCVAVIQRYREGEPVVRLGGVDAPAPPPWRLEALLLGGEATLVYGQGGIGKSYLAGLCAVLVDQGLTFGKLRPAKSNVLYLDYETGSSVAARRFNSLHNGFGLDESSNVFYRFCYQPVASEIAELQKLVADNDIGLVIVDSAGPACGGEPEAAAMAIAYFTALRSLKVASLTIAHRSKGVGSSGPFGSVYWVNYPRNIYELKKAQTVGDNLIHVALLHEKSNEGRLHPSVSYQFSFSDGNIVSVSSEAMEDVPEFFDNLSIISKAEVVLRDEGPMPLADLVSQIGYKGNANALSSQLSRSQKFRYGNNDEGEKIWHVVG